MVSVPNAAELEPYKTRLLSEIPIGGAGLGRLSHYRWSNVERRLREPDSVSYLVLSKHFLENQPVGAIAAYFESKVGEVGIVTESDVSNMINALGYSMHIGRPRGARNSNAPKGDAKAERQDDSGKGNIYGHNGAPHVGTFYLRSCTKCNGDMILDEDHFGIYLDCLQCGHHQDVEIPQKAA